jgi:hypothetical protein
VLLEMDDVTVAAAISPFAEAQIANVCERGEAVVNTH